jgi:tetratricopeptide (TPR) repeat protein
MARHVLRTAALAAALMLLLSCSNHGPVFSVLRGNLAYSRGDYQAALVHYMASGEPETNGWVAFNMGNVYYALGEQEAALGAWAAARSLIDEESSGQERSRSETLLIHAASYNRGVLLYELGRFREAYDEFVYALTVRSTSEAAKTNLELTLARIRSAEGADEETAAGEGDGSGEGDQQSIRILEYVRRKEAQQWYANRETEDTSGDRDW